MNFWKVSQKNWKNDLYDMACSMTICNEKCPTCKRICGFQEATFHSCLYGHQMEGMGGMHSIRSKKSVVRRCEDSDDISCSISWNRIVYAWQNFKNKKKTDKIYCWSYDYLESTKNDQNLKKKFKDAWNLVGRKMCETYKIKFCDDNNLYRNSDSDSPKNNFVFLIDSSSIVLS